jgi:hypothetical protein
VRFYIDVKGKRERFTKKRGSRKFSVDSTENTLVDDKNPEVVNKIPVTDQYVMPDWYVESGILFDTKVDSKRMITNKKIRDTQAMQSVINNFLTLLQVDPQLGQMVDVSKLFEKIMKFADMDAEDIMKNLTGSQEEKLLQKIADSKNAALTPLQYAEEMQEMAGVPNPQQSQALSVRGVGAQDALQRAAEGAL